MNGLADLFAAPGLEATAYPPTSRYHGLAVVRFAAPDGSTIVHLARRFVPPPEAYAPLALHVVSGGDRPDTVAATYYGDPTQYWQIADTNLVDWPAELTERVGRRLVIGARSITGGR